MKIGDILDHLAKVEQTIGKLYAHFSAQFSDNPAAADFFAKLSDDEKMHYDLVAYQRRLVKGNEQFFTDLEFKTDEGDRLVKHAESVIRSGSKLSLKDAVELARKIEATAAEHHHKSLIGKSNAEMGTLIKSLGSADQAHGEQIRKFMQSQGIQ